MYYLEPIHPVPCALAFFVPGATVGEDGASISKSVASKVQTLPSASAELQFEMPEDTVVGIVHASWKVHGVAGGVVFYRGTLLKSFSRRIETPCLSSAQVGSWRSRRRC